MPVSQEEYGAAYQKNFGSTKRLLLLRGANVEEVEDFVQEAWLKGWKYIHQFDHHSSLITWVNAIAVNVFFDDFRRKSCRPILEELDFQARSREETPLSRIDTELILTICPVKDRNILLMLLEGFSQKEISRELGCKHSTLKVKLFRLRPFILERLAHRREARKNKERKEVSHEEASSFT